MMLDKPRNIQIKPRTDTHQISLSHWGVFTKEFVRMDIWEGNGYGLRDEPYIVLIDIPIWNIRPITNKEDCDYV